MPDQETDLPREIPARLPPRRPNHRHLPREQRRALTLSRLATGCTVLLVAATATLSVLYVQARTRLGELEEVGDVVHAARDAELFRLRRMTDDLVTIDQQQRETIAHLNTLHDMLRRELSATRDELAAIGAERDAGRRIAAALSAGAGDGAALASGATAERAALDARLVALEARLASVTGERDLARRGERTLRTRAESLEARLKDAKTSTTAETARLRAWVVSHVNALEGVLQSSGVNVERLKKRMGKQLGGNQGGPFVPALAKSGPPPVIASQPGLAGDLSRLGAATRLMATLPLVPPMASYRLTSPFGGRRDPINGRAAQHEGQDFGGPNGSSILATAPGRVVRAGQAGDYGIMVEIDHGLGLRTRYAHLSKALVRAGERVTLRQPVGIMGSTGRSTGQHLHYEIRLDGRPLDPANFLDAGRHLRHVLKG